MAGTYQTTFEIPQNHVQGFMADLERQGIRWVQPRQVDDSCCNGEIAGAGFGGTIFWLNFWPASSDCAHRRFAVVCEPGRGRDKDVGLQMLSRIKEVVFAHEAVVCKKEFLSDFRLAAYQALQTTPSRGSAWPTSRPSGESGDESPHSKIFAAHEGADEEQYKASCER